MIINSTECKFISGTWEQFLGGENYGENALFVIMESSEYVYCMQ